MPTALDAGSSELPLTSHHQATTPAPIPWVSGRRNEPKEQSKQGRRWRAMAALFQGGGAARLALVGQGCLWLPLADGIERTRLVS